MQFVDFLYLYIAREGVTKTRVILFIVWIERVDIPLADSLNFQFLLFYEDAFEKRVEKRQNEAQAGRSDRCGGFSGSPGYNR